MCRANGDIGRVDSGQVIPTADARNYKQYSREKYWEHWQCDQRKQIHQKAFESDNGSDMRAAGVDVQADEKARHRRSVIIAWLSAVFSPVLMKYVLQGFFPPTEIDANLTWQSEFCNESKY